MPNILINGVEPGWYDLQANIGGAEIDGITALSYGEKQAKENVYGKKRTPISRARGKIEYEGSITLLGSELLPLLRRNGGSLTAIRPFNIVVAFQVEGGPVYTVTLYGCEFLEKKLDVKEGDLKMEFQLPLVIAKIEFA